MSYCCTFSGLFGRISLFGQFGSIRAESDSRNVGSGNVGSGSEAQTKV